MTGAKDGKPAKKRGPDPWEPTKDQRAQARALTACSHGVRDIAIFFGKDVKTVRRAFKDELEDGRSYFHSRLTVGLAQKALAGNLAAIIFTLKCKYQWRENQRLELTGKDGQPLSFSDLSDTAARELLDALRATLGAAGAGSGPDEEEAPSLH